MDPLLQIKKPNQFTPNAQVQPMQQIPQVQPQVTQAIQPQIQANLGYDPKFDYKSQMNQLAAVNANDPQIQVLQGQRDAKLNALYGNDFQKRINELSAVNPNNPDIADLTRLREAKVKQQQEVTPVTEQTNDQLMNKGMAQFQEAQQNKEAIMKTIVNTPFTDNYIEQKKEYLAAMGKPFEYNSDADLAFQQAKKKTTNAVMAVMNQRGFLSNDMTQDELVDAYGDLEVKFRSVAFDEYNKNIANAMQNFNMLQGLTEFDYKQYRDWIGDNLQYANENVDVAYKNLEAFKSVIDYNNQEEAKKLEAYKTQISKQTERVKMLGYVDNEASIILGLKVGTLSEEATKQAYEMKSYAAKQKLDLEYKKKVMDQEHKFTVAEMQEKIKAEKELASINFGYDTQKINLNAANSRSNADHSASLQKDVAAYKSTLDTTKSKAKSYDEYYSKALGMTTDTTTVERIGGKTTKPKYTDGQIRKYIYSLPIEDGEQLAMINSIFGEDNKSTMPFVPFAGITRN